VVAMQVLKTIAMALREEDQLLSFPIRVPTSLRQAEAVVAEAVLEVQAARVGAAHQVAKGVRGRQATLKHREVEEGLK
jgi:hypothetical protein